MALAAVCREYGGPDVVRVEEWDAGPVGPGQVRVRVQAASVNFPAASNFWLIPGMNTRVGKTCALR